jgi:hypothetical protein
VTFDYSDNEDFEYEDTDIKIYHVENKNEEITQNRSKKVQEVEINREISNKAR